MSDAGQESTGKDVLERLRNDTREWEASGIITEAQVAAILSYYDHYFPVSAKPQIYARLSTILATMGAVLVGLGIILFVGANWQDIPLVMRFALLCATIVICNGSGYFLLYIRGYARSGKAIFLVGSLAFGAGVFLATQVYHYETEPPFLLFWWCMGVIPMAYILRLRSVLCLGVGIFIVAFIWFVVDRGGDMESTVAFIALVTALGSALFAIGTLHRFVNSLVKFSGVYVTFGMGILVSAIYILSFEEILHDDFLDMMERNPVPEFIPIALLSSLALVCWVSYIAIKRRQIAAIHFPILDLVAIPWGIMVASIAYWAPMIGNSVLFAAVFNTVLAITIVAIIVAGVAERKNYLINMGLLFFGLLLLTRYIDLMWGMMNGALFFIIGGMFLLLIGFFLERARRRLVLEVLPVGDPE